MPRPTPTTRVRRAALACVVVAALVGLVAAPAAAAKKPKTVLRIAPGDIVVHRTGDAPETLPDDVRDAVMRAVTGYMKAATVKPLRKGTADEAALGAMLAPSVTARLGSPDRAVLVDEGLPKSVGPIKVTALPVTLTGLADESGSVVVVTANLATKAVTKTKKGKLSIVRTGELVFEPTDGAWKITGYTLTVERAGKGVAPAAAPEDPAATAPAS